MANPLSSLSAFVAAYKVPLLVGAGGLAAVSAYSSKRRQSEAMAAVSAAPSQLVTGATGSEAAALIGQGAGLGLQGAALGLQTAERGLGLAEMATVGAQGLAAVLAGSQAQVAAVAGSALGTVAGALADVVTSPTGLVVTPQPTAPAPIPGTPTATTTRATALGYRARILGAGIVDAATGRCGAWSPRRLSFAGPSSAPVTRVACSNGIAWRTSAGGYTGAHYLSWASGGAGLWTIEKGTRLQTLVNGVVTGTRDSWAPIGKTGS